MNPKVKIAIFIATVVITIASLFLTVGKHCHQNACQYEKMQHCGGFRKHHCCMQSSCSYHNNMKPNENCNQKDTTVKK